MKITESIMQELLNMRSLDDSQGPGHIYVIHRSDYENIRATIDKVLAAQPEMRALTVTLEEAAAIRVEYHRRLRSIRGTSGDEDLRDAIHAVLSQRPTPEPPAPANPVPGTSVFPKVTLRDSDFDVPQTTPEPWKCEFCNFTFKRNGRCDHCGHLAPEPTVPEGSSIIDNEVLADLYKKLSGKSAHASDCATSIAPAETPRPCDCEAPQDNAAVVEEAWNIYAHYANTEEGIRAVVEFSRRGMHTTEEVAKVVTVLWHLYLESGSTLLDPFLYHLRKALTTPAAPPKPKPTKAEQELRDKLYNIACTNAGSPESCNAIDRLVAELKKGTYIFNSLGGDL